MVFFVDCFLGRGRGKGVDMEFRASFPVEISMGFSFRGRELFEKTLISD